MRFDGFLYSTDVAGESSDGRDNNANEIEILSYSLRIFRNDTLSQNNGNPILATHGVLTVIKYVDVATPALAKLLYTNKRVDEMTLIVRGMMTPNAAAAAVDDELLKITIKKVLPTRIHHVGNPRLHLFGRDLETARPIPSGSVLECGPLEEVDLHYFQSVKWESGNTQYTWNDPDH